LAEQAKQVAEGAGTWGVSAGVSAHPDPAALGKFRKAGTEMDARVTALLTGGKIGTVAPKRVSDHVIDRVIDR
jgi:hypothetical protein